MVTKDQMKAVIESLKEAQIEYFQLAFEEEFIPEVGPPASSDQINMLETSWGGKLPASYRMFLELHNGWAKFQGDGKLLATDDQNSDWVIKRIQGMVSMWDKDIENPFEKGSIPILLGQTLKHCLALGPSENGNNFEFVVYDYGVRERAFPDFYQFLQYQLEVMQDLVELKKNGELPED